MPRHSARPPGRCPRPSRASPRASWRRWTTTSTRRRRSACCSISRALSEQRDRGLGTPEARADFVAGVAELVRLARVLGLLQRRVEGGGPPPEVERLVGERTEARARRDFRRSDELRAEIQRLGRLVEDTPGRPRLTRKSGRWPR